MPDSTQRRSSIRLPAFAAIVATNAILLIGVVAWVWDALEVMFLFWWESVVLGIVTLAAMFWLRPAAGPPAYRAQWALLMGPIYLVMHACYAVLIPVVAVPGFTYGAFNPAELARQPLAALREPLLAPLAMMVLFQVSRVAHRVRKLEVCEPRTVQRLLAPLGGRIVFMHAPLLLGAFLLDVMGASVWPIVLLIAFKTLAEIVEAHLDSRTLEGVPR